MCYRLTALESCLIGVASSPAVETLPGSIHADMPATSMLVTSSSAGHYCGESVDKIAWFNEYMLNTTLHPPFEDCVGDDDGYVHTLTCGTDFLLFHFYNGHPNASSTFQYIYLPKAMKNRQDLLQPWEKIITLIYKPYVYYSAAQRSRPAPSGDVQTLSPPPPGTHIFGPARDAKAWEPVGILVDEDSLPHILTFTNCDYKNACNRTEDWASDETVWGLEEAASRFRGGAGV